MDPFTRSASVSASARVRASWTAGPPAISEVLARASDNGVMLVDPVVADAEERWNRGLPARLEEYLAADPGLTEQRDLCRALIMCEAARRTSEPMVAIRTDLLARFPSLAGELDEVLELLSLMREAEEAGPALTPGTRLGKYELREHIGSGGFGHVWRALDSELGRYVALKLFAAPVRPGGSTGHSRLVAEARAAAALDHENIVRVHAAGLFEDHGLAYLDSQLAGDPEPTGNDPLHVRVARSLEECAPMPPREAARVIEAACRGVGAAHARAVLHRDIKPGNILLTLSGRVMVADFGLALEARAEADARIVGTPAYMPPEQARGETATPQSDVFALGATLRFLLTGTPPYAPSGQHSSSAREDVLEQARRAELRPLAATIPTDLRAIIERATASDPAARYTSADQLAADLHAFRHWRPVAARVTPPLHRARLFARRHRAAVLVSAVAAAAIGVSTTVYVLRLGEERDRALTAEHAADREMRRAVAAEGDALSQLEEAIRQRDTALAINQYAADSIVAALRSSPTDKPTIQEALDLAERRMHYSVSERPLIEAGVRVVLASGLIANKEHDRAVKHLVEAVRVRAEQLGIDAPDTLRARRLLAWARSHAGDLERARAEMNTVAPLCATTLGESDVDTGLAYAALGQWALTDGQLGKAEPLLARAERSLRDGPGIGLLEWQEVGGRLAELYYKQDRLRERTELRQAIADAAAKKLGRDDVRTLNARHNVARALWDEGRMDEAEQALRTLVDDSIAVNGRYHAGTVFAHWNLADFLIKVRRDPAAASELTRAAIPENLRPSSLPAVRGPLLVVEARALAALQKHDEALAILKQVRADARAMGNAGEKLAKQAQDLEAAIARTSPQHN
ncbi:MAG TPA: protein kinase [Phycisphaerales bacterium]|nr:protein kinase [Phycisphaerales bacterium]